MSINGDKPVPTFDTMIRNTDPGSNAGIPGLSLFAGMTPGGLPVGLEIDGPVGSDTKLLGTGDVDRSHSGHGAARRRCRFDSCRMSSHNVIARSVATKQSSFRSPKRELDCFAALAMTWIVGARRERHTWRMTPHTWS